MIQKPFDQIEKSDIDALIENSVAEGRTLDDKQALHGNRHVPLMLSRQDDDIDRISMLSLEIDRKGVLISAARIFGIRLERNYVY